MTFNFTPGPWSVFAQPITGRADAILELIEQVQATEPVADHIYLINADGKCPAIAGCGPTSEANARLIAAAPAMAEVLTSWPLNELLGMIEDSGDPKMWERALWFMENRDAALALLNPEPTPATSERNAA